MSWETFVGLAILLCAPVAIALAINRIAGRCFPSSVVARYPKTLYLLVGAAWLTFITFFFATFLSREAPLALRSPPASQHPSPPLSSPPSNLPKWWLPWPPPSPSASIAIPISKLLRNKSTESGKLLDIDESLTSSLRAAGHFEGSYYGVPGGFALVTRLESIQANGAPKPGDLRWDIDLRSNRPFSLTSYFEALFSAPPGRYRVIVFVVTAERFGTEYRPIDRDDATRWLREGANALPWELTNRPIEQGALCTALIYEFRKTSESTESKLMRPGEISADRHIIGTGLQRMLR